MFQAAPTQILETYLRIWSFRGGVLDLFPRPSRCTWRLEIAAAYAKDEWHSTGVFSWQVCFHTLHRVGSKETHTQEETFHQSLDCEVESQRPASWDIR